LIFGRIAMGIEYDGTGFRGWQTQTGVPTVQASLEAAISRVADHAVTIHCAGRTDAGVHALEQVVHFETTTKRRERSWVLGCNVNLPSDVAVRWAHQVDDRFHARFSAVARHYRYQILIRRTRSPLRHNRAVWIHESLDAERMREAGHALVGEHDFTSFRAVACQAKSPIRRVYYLDISEHAGMLSLQVGANGFLHHMVRNIAGVLMAVGRGEAPVTWTQELLQVRDRRLGGVTAPPHGLYFVRADYPSEFALPQREGVTPLQRLSVD
jgi:tRNA pseudouridine38-40 synthase